MERPAVKCGSRGRRPVWHYESVAVPSTIVSPDMPAGDVHAAMIWAPVIVEIAVPLECAPRSVPAKDPATVTLPPEFGRT